MMGRSIISKRKRSKLCSQPSNQKRRKCVRECRVNHQQVPYVEADVIQPTVLGQKSRFMHMPVELVRFTMMYLDYNDLTSMATMCKSFNWCVAEYLKKLSSFDFHDVHAIGRLLVLLTSAWPSDRTSAFFPALFARWKTTLLQNRGYPFRLALPNIELGDGACILDKLAWENPRTLRGCRSKDQLLMRARSQCKQLHSTIHMVAGLQFSLLHDDLESILAHVRSLPVEPTADNYPIIPQGPQLLMHLREYFHHMLSPFRAHSDITMGEVTLDQCRTLLLKVCRKILVRLRPTSPDIVLAVQLFRRQLTDCVRGYGIKPCDFEEPDVARGLVKLIRKSRLYFVDQCGNPNCGKSERVPQEHKRCSACAWVKYCSKECQRSDWAKHKEICQVLHNAIYPIPHHP